MFLELLQDIWPPTLSVPSAVVVLEVMLEATVA